MRIELMDEPILIIKSASPSNIAGDSPKETLRQIESLLEEEIIEIRDKIVSDDSNSFFGYLTQFNLHLQTDNEVASVVLESEWRDQMGMSLDGETAESDELIDLEVSELMRIIKIYYSDDTARANLERKELFLWLSKQSINIPIVSGVCSFDYLIISAKDILVCMNSLKESLKEFI